MLHLWFESWVEGLAFPDGMAVELRTLARLPGELEIDAMSERTAVYGWTASTLQVFVDGTLVHPFDQAVPDIVSKLTTRENITLLFGEPPVPAAEEGGSPRKRP